MTEFRNERESRNKTPNLKSGSGAGFFFEDQVTAVLFCEMMLGVGSLGTNLKITERVERQASDWEPFGDLLVTVRDTESKLISCGCSVKSNRQITSNGCSTELSNALWQVFSSSYFTDDCDLLGLFCATLSKKNSDLLNSLCKQAREIDPEGLDRKLTHANILAIYNSFKNASDNSTAGLPGHILRHLIVREFDFEDMTSRSEEDAIRGCADLLVKEESNRSKARDLWDAFLRIAVQQRISGGAVTRSILTAKLRNDFPLKDDPSDRMQWATIRRVSHERIEEIHTTLPNGLALPRLNETGLLKKAISNGVGAYILGHSGYGKSALAKLATINAQESGVETAWINAEFFPKIKGQVPDIANVLRRTRRPGGLLIIDAIERCFTDAQLDSIGNFAKLVTKGDSNIWKVVLVCQTQSWARASRRLVRFLSGHDSLANLVECGNLSDEDFELVRSNAPALKKLALHKHSKFLLRSPKMLDLLLRNEPNLDRLLVGEVDVIDWWWNEQVMKGKNFAGEERFARSLGIHLADALTSEVSPDFVKTDHQVTDSLISRQILSRTDDGRIRFDHDLLADWSRVMHLRSLGPDSLDFMLEHSENPPWLRAVRLFSQHLLERVADHERWQMVVDACTVEARNQKEAPARNLQILDTWLEGIAYCSDPLSLLKQNRDQLFAKDAYLLERLLRRLLHNATLPDPILQNQFQKINPSIADSVALRYRLPIASIWQPFILFLIANPETTTDCLPVTLAELGLMWGRLDEYLGFNWSPLSEIVLLNGEKELRREVAGIYRHDRGSRSIGGKNNSRVTIYSAALRAASQNPDRACNLALKASGRKEWDEDDLTGEVNKGWLGEWRKRSIFEEQGRHVIYPVETWTDGPRRSTSRDFYHAWFETNASLPLFKNRSKVACEVTLGLLLDWPKTEIIKGDHNIFSIHCHGFHTGEGQIDTVFWTEGPFIGYLRTNWIPAIELVIRLTNFATDRYHEWWSLDPKVEKVKFHTPQGETVWKGNHQVFAWNRYDMNTPRMVTCALMALEKWLDEKIEAGESITEAIKRIYIDGQSLALAGVLICVGKRHPFLFVSDLKPLLFAQKLYDYDLRVIQENFGGGSSMFESEFVFKERREWEELSGRKKWLRDACLEWMLTKPEFEPVFMEISSDLNAQAEELPEDSNERGILVRRSLEFNPMLWDQKELEGGQVELFNEKLSELDDGVVKSNNNLKLELLSIPYQCSDLLQKRPELKDGDLVSIWNQIQDSDIAERAEVLAKEDHSGAEFLDFRHARAGMIAVLVCLGETWLNQDPVKFDFLDKQIWNILNSQHDFNAYSPEEIQSDFECFLARAVVRRWAANINDSEWRGTVGGFVTAYRYRTVQDLFDEAFMCRDRLGDAYGDLEALALSFSAVRLEIRMAEKFKMVNFAKDLITTWNRDGVPKFAKGKGPIWKEDWASIDVGQFPRSADNWVVHAEQKSNDRGFYNWLKNVLRKVGVIKGAKEEPVHQTNAEFLITNSSGRRELCRAHYGLEMGVILASFGHLPCLSDASDSTEREHWLSICRELLSAFLRTLPLSDSSDDDEWHYDVWSTDEKVFEIVAARLFECTVEEGRGFWQSLLNLPPAAHHHISQFLKVVLLESLRTDVPNIERLMRLWIPFADHLAAQKIWTDGQSRDAGDVWKVLLLLDTYFPSTSNEIFAPLVKKLAVHYYNYVVMIKGNPYRQNELVAFLITQAAAPILIDVFERLHESWNQVNGYFWRTVIKWGNFERLLEFVWSNQFEEIQNNTLALDSFKTLTLNLAAHDSAVAIDIQNRIGTLDTQ